MGKGRNLSDSDIVVIVCLVVLTIIALSAIIPFFDYIKEMIDDGSSLKEVNESMIGDLSGTIQMLIALSFGFGAIIYFLWKIDKDLNAHHISPKNEKSKVEKEKCIKPETKQSNNPKQKDDLEALLSAGIITKEEYNKLSKE